MLKTYTNIYPNICKYSNLEDAFKKAKKRKSGKIYVIKFGKNLSENLANLRNELVFHTYKPTELKTFILRDPKTRTISKAEFKDRVVHHALVRVIEPLFEKCFIHDSYANRKGKGVHLALKRFDVFKRKVSKNNTRSCFVLKADIKHYFDNVDKNILTEIISKKIKDKRVVWLIKKILDNHKKECFYKGMPLGNLTSQFFANVYLNELDQFVKHELKAKHYIRYVDDFVLLHNKREILENYKKEINKFLMEKLKLELHEGKSKIIPLRRGIKFLGFRVFYYHKLLRRSNLNNFLRKIEKLKEEYDKGVIDEEILCNVLRGWFGYAIHGNTYKLRKNIMNTLKHFY